MTTTQEDCFATAIPIDVRPGLIAWPCQQCGALAFNLESHVDFHLQLRATLTSMMAAMAAATGAAIPEVEAVSLLSPLMEEIKARKWTPTERGEWGNL